MSAVRWSTQEAGAPPPCPLFPFLGLRTPSGRSSVTTHWVCSVGRVSGRGTGVRGRGVRVTTRLLKQDGAGLARVITNTEWWGPRSVGGVSSSYLDAGPWF